MEVGYAGITTRRLAEEAGVNHGLVHYYFGSNENLLVRALERFTERLIERQHQLYSADEPFLEKWRTAMRYLISEDVTYEKVWLELQALGWNHPELRERLARQRRVARRPDGGVRGAAPRARPRHPAGRARLARHDLQHRHDRRAPRRHRHRTRGALLNGSIDGCRADRARRSEQTRARYPDESGYVERDGVNLYWEVYGAGEPTVLLMPTWSIIHSRHWKMQIPYLARHCRVLTFDGRGNGRSDRPTSPTRTARRSSPPTRSRSWMRPPPSGRARLALAGAERSLLVAASRPERVEKLVFIAPALPLPPVMPRRRAAQEFDEPHDEYVDWGKWNRHYWVESYEDFLEFFFSQCFTEPHSTKQREDAVGWGLETTAETLVGDAARAAAPGRGGRARAPRPRPLSGARHPRSEDAVRPCASGARLAELAGGELVVLEGSGHLPHARDPVKVNLLLRDFVKPAPRPARWVRGKSRRKRALYVSSPIGLGHAQRDAAIADELRKLHPDLDIDWLAQHPVTAALEARGERIHPASAYLANESTHIESESAEHDLHCFQAIRRMDEILLANFMVFHDLVREEQYDLWIGDEAWELDYYLHENPEQKRAAYVWLTDFVGWLPMEDGGDRESYVTTDYNAEMIEHIARFPRLRDRAIFVGNPDDIVPDSFGAELPLIRDWTEQNYDFAGYVTGFDPRALGDRGALGYRDDERVCIVAVGGSGVGGHLLRRVIDSFPQAKERVPTCG